MQKQRFASVTLALMLVSSAVTAQVPVTKDTTIAPRKSTASGEVTRPGIDAPNPNALVATMQTDAHAMGLLHAANVAEIQAANLASTRATDPDVKAFATRMISEHTALDQQGSALATRLGVTPALPDSTLPNIAQREMTALSSAMATPGRPDTMAGRGRDTSMMGHAMHGGDFDRTYITQQVNDHQLVLSLIDAAISRTQNAELKTSLQNDVRPKVADHLRMAQQLQARLR